MKVLVCGSRKFNDFQFMCDKLDTKHITHIISGGAIGADTFARRYAKVRDIEFVEVKPNWDKYGKKAGFIRNIAMLEMNPDMVIAFWDGTSRGTKHTIDNAKKMNIPVEIIEV